MTLSELEALIAEVRAEVGDDADPVVKMAVQPNYPFEWSVRGGVVVNKSAEDQDEWDAAAPADREGHERPADDHVVYLVQGSQQEYLQAPSDQVWQ